MATWSPLTTHWAVNLTDCESRRGARIDTIQNHHTATSSKAAALAAFAPGGRTVTPNYFVAGREVWGIVPEEHRAYTSGSFQDDARAVTIETLNVTNAPYWGFEQDTLDTLAALNADIAKRRGISLVHASPGVIEHRNIYEWWRRSYATACAGPSFNINDIIEAAKAANVIPAPIGEREEEDMWKPTVHVRVDSGRSGEYMLAQPEIGTDLKAGEKRTSGAVTTFRGYMVTSNAVIGQAWARMYARGIGGETSRTDRAGYITIQAEAQRVSLELS